MSDPTGIPVNAQALEGFDEPEDETKRKTHNVRWKDGDWERIVQAIAKINEQEHLSMTPAELIRSSTMKTVDKVLGPREQL